MTEQERKEWLAGFKFGDFVKIAPSNIIDRMYGLHESRIVLRGWSSLFDPITGFDDGGAWLEPLSSRDEIVQRLKNFNWGSLKNSELEAVMAALPSS